jgi:hypothetical protein
MHDFFLPSFVALVMFLRFVDVNDIILLKVVEGEEKVIDG